VLASFLIKEWEEKYDLKRDALRKSDVDKFELRYFLYWSAFLGRGDPRGLNFV